MIRARSGGDERRWSPALISSMVTSSACSRSARRSAVCQGTSGSRWPCSRWTGHRIGSGARSTRCSSRLVDEPAGYRIGIAAIGRRLHPIALVGERAALLGRRPRQQQIRGEIGRRRDADQAGDALGRASATSSMIQPPMLEPTTSRGPAVGRSTIASASSAQRPIVPSAKSPDERRGPSSRSA